MCYMSTDNDKREPLILREAAKNSYSFGGSVTKRGGGKAIVAGPLKNIFFCGFPDVGKAPPLPQHKDILKDIIECLANTFLICFFFVWGKGKILSNVNNTVSLRSLDPFYV